jgi:hypothetical protein
MAHEPPDITKPNNIIDLEASNLIVLLLPLRRNWGTERLY